MARNRYLDDEEDKARLNTSILKRLFRYTLPYKKMFIIGLILLVIEVLISLLWPRLVQWLIDDVLNTGSRYENNVGIMLAGIGAVTAALMFDVFITSKRVVYITRLGHDTIHDIRKELFDHIQSLTFKYFDDRPAGKILVRVTSYVDSLANLLSSQILQLIVDAFTILCITVIIFVMNWRLALISLAVLVPLVLFTNYIRKVIAHHSRLVRNKTSNRTAYIHENIMGLFITQSFDREDYNHHELERLDDEVNKRYIPFHLVSSTMGPAVEILSTVAQLLVYFFAIRFIANGEMTLGALTAFVSYMTRFWQPISSFTAIFNQFCEATGNIEKIFETIDEQPDITDSENAYELPDIEGRVEYKNVTFAYDEDNIVLDNVSFTVEPGQMIAFVGPTGAGKTTVVNLLSRFYEVTGGSVTIDGHDVRDVTLDSLRTQVGVMMQDSFVFSGTVLDNIRYGRPEATDEECIDAARKIYASDFIEALPNGYNTVLQEGGAGLSTGERQLLSFARAILADPRILILDEATSSIDTKTELLIQRALQKLLEGRTSFVIAHRLSTIKRADQIMCIANHGIAERGTHSELMAKKGIYYELNMSQYRALVNKGE